MEEGFKVNIYDITDELEQKTEVRFVNELIGKGVFTTKNINEGELICFWPVDSIRSIKNEIPPLKTQEEFDVFRMLNRYIAPLKGGEYNGILLDYESDEWPFHGHRINDGASMLKYKRTREETDLMVGIYLRVSQIKQNVEIFYPGDTQLGLVSYKNKKGICVVAKRDLKKGEQLYLHYGAAQWFHFIQHNRMD